MTTTTHEAALAAARKRLQLCAELVADSLQALERAELAADDIRVRLTHDEADRAAAEHTVSVLTNAAASAASVETAVEPIVDSVEAFHAARIRSLGQAPFWLTEPVVVHITQGECQVCDALTDVERRAASA